MLLLLCIVLIAERLHAAKVETSLEVEASGQRDDPLGVNLDDASIQALSNELVRYQQEREHRERLERHEEAQNYHLELQRREQKFLEVMGRDRKARFDNLRRAARWLFSEGRLEEGASMYARAMEYYTEALREPLKDFASYTDMGRSLQRQEEERASALREAQEAAALSPAPTSVREKQATEAVFLEYAKSCTLCDL